MVKVLEYSPSFAALAIVTMFVTLGVSLAKKGILVTALTQRQMLRTNSASCRRSDALLIIF